MYVYLMYVYLMYCIPNVCIPNVCIPNGFELTFLLLTSIGGKYGARAPIYKNIYFITKFTEFTECIEFIEFTKFTELIEFTEFTELLNLLNLLTLLNFLASMRLGLELCFKNIHTQHMFLEHISVFVFSYKYEARFVACFKIFTKRKYMIKIKCVRFSEICAYL